ncbi:SCP2 sterol-binding domain-containing protein [Bacillus kwashiorkori]|uniref:SCP2 sterol-binding domain-containing protein n=1 Tax=Bacillus kwashiorkori TaxID=1522318 RepID=UPI000781464F|nr:SCP2 sterol-binding domain-containing protein [Bacillus kwashiorkori]
MERLFQQWQNAISNKYTVLPLLPSTPIKVMIKTMTETIYLSISKETIQFQSEFIENVECKIDCNDNILEKLLIGNIRLQEAIRFGEVNVEGSFRHILLLESLFYLVGQE